MAKKPTPTIELVPVAQLRPYAGNARTHSEAQVAKIAASITEFGWMNPVLIDGEGGVIAGHGRLLAAQLLKLAAVPCLRVTHLSEAQRRAYVIADNRLAEDAGWDKTLLRVELADLSAFGFDLALTGFDQASLADILRPAAPSKDPDAAGALGREAKAATKVGTVWTLGPHRLVCGDATAPAAYAALLEGGLVDAVWTDPPYNVGYATAAGSIENDALPDAKFRAFLVELLRLLAAAVKPGGAVYCAHADTEGLNFRAAWSEAGLKLSGVVIWRKDSLVLGRSDYQWIHEPILYGWRPGRAHRWYGGRKQTTVADLGDRSPFLQLEDGRWQLTVGGRVFIVAGEATIEELETSVLVEARPSRSPDHPTMKPVALIERMLANSAKAGALVLDPCSGSGSTLIACERLGMSARCIELSRAYCDVTVRRWQEYSGGEAVDQRGRRFPG